MNHPSLINEIFNTKVYKTLDIPYKINILSDMFPLKYIFILIT